jgi:hypothetical protein
MGWGEKKPTEKTHTKTFTVVICVRWGRGALKFCMVFVFMLLDIV